MLAGASTGSAGPRVICRTTSLHSVQATHRRRRAPPADAPPRLVRSSKKGLADRPLRRGCRYRSRAKTMQRAQLLRQLVLDSQYVVDEQLLAAAILARGTTRSLVSDAAFRNDRRGPEVRSFRPTKQARSFRPCNLQLTRDGRAMPARWRRS